jgi:hypothetical protein
VHEQERAARRRRPIQIRDEAAPTVDVDGQLLDDHLGVERRQPALGSGQRQRQRQAQSRADPGEQRDTEQQPGDRAADQPELPSP